MRLLYSELKGFGLHALDDRLGSVKDVFFDDYFWGLRYFVADTRKWWPGRTVLLSPASVSAVNFLERDIVLDLTREQVEGAPSVDEDMPVSRQHEERLSSYYGWSPYWMPLGPAGMTAYPTFPVFAGFEHEDLPPDLLELLKKEEVEGDKNLRSCSEVKSYHIAAIDGPMGHVDDFVISDEHWHIPHLVVETRNWLPGKKVLVPVFLFHDIDWSARTISVNLARDMIQDAPDFVSLEDFDLNQERELFKYFFKRVDERRRSDPDFARYLLGAQQTAS